MDKRISKIFKNISDEITATTNTITGRQTIVNEPVNVTPVNHGDPPSKHFTGREKLLQTLHHRLQECSTKQAIIERIVMIHGLGGMGKSELSRKYAQTYINDPIIRNVAWIDAETKISIEASFTSLALKLNLPTEGKEAPEIVDGVYEHFSTYLGTGLFIFDNATDTLLKEKEFLPKQHTKRSPLFLITTRDSDWDVEGHGHGIPEENKIAIDELSDEESVEFLKKSLRLTKDQESDEDEMNAIRLLAKTLEGYPLGLTLACSSIRHNKRASISQSAAHYIKAEAPKEAEILSTETATHTKYKLIMDSVWSATLDKIGVMGKEGADALKLLNFMAYLPADRTTLKRVQEIFKFVYKRHSAPDSLLILEKYSLISINKEKDNVDRVQIHRLVQRCTRDKLQRQNNFSFLFGICNHIIHKEYNEDNEQDWTCVQGHLKEKNWPHESLYFSIIVSSKALQKNDKESLERSWRFVSDVQEFLQLQKSKEVAEEQFKLTEDGANLLHLCLFYFYFHKNKKYENDPLFKADDTASFVETMEKAFVASLRSALNVMLENCKDSKNASANDLHKSTTFTDVVQQHIFKVCYRILFSREHTFNQELGQQKEIIEFLLSRVSSNAVCKIEKVYSTYKLFREHCSDPENSVSGAWYASVLVKLHHDFYTTLDQDSLEQLKNYWKRGGPIPYCTISLRIKLKEYADWNNFFAERFFTEEGPQLLAQHLHYLNTQVEISWTTFDLFVFVTHLAFDLKYAERFVSSPPFMESLYKYTNSAFKSEQNTYQGACIETWFALFSKNQTVTDSGGHDWSINAVTKEMSSYVVKKASPHYFRDDILKEFVEANQSELGSVAVKLANRVHRTTAPSAKHCIVM